MAIFATMRFFRNRRHSEFTGKNDFHTKCQPEYEELVISAQSDKERFTRNLKVHQQGGSGYPAFCRQCAETGIEKWVVNLEAMTWTYYDKAGNEILAEAIPE